jgi:hypothetical protein
MRFGAPILISLGIVSATDSSLRGAFIKPHLRSLIASVAKERTVQFEDFRIAEVKNDEFCQPALTFERKVKSEKSEQSEAADASTESTSGTQDAADGQPLALEYMLDLQKSALHALTDTRRFLQTMEYDTKQDDYRRAKDMLETWTASIQTEVRHVISVLEGQKTPFTEEAKAAGGLGAAAKTDAKEGPLVVLDGSADKGHVASPDELTTKGREGSGKAHVNTKDGWEQIATHNTESAEKSGKVIENLETVLKAANTMFETHLTNLRTDVNYILKWPSDFDEEKLAALANAGRGASGGDESGVSTIAHEFKEQPGTPVPESKNAYSHTSVSLTGKQLIEFVKTHAIPPADNSASPVDTMENLTVMLNVLHVRRLGLQDARTSLKSLIELIGTQMKTVVETINGDKGLLKNIADDLESNKDAIFGVYKNAEIFLKNGDEKVFPTDDATGAVGDDWGYEDTLTALTGAESGDLHDSMKPRAKYIVNAIRQLHAHLISLVSAHNGDLLKTYKAVDAEKIKTDILTVTDKMEAQKATPYTEAAQATNFDGVLTALEKNARRTALCMLYGRVDGLQNLVELTDNPNKEEGANGSFCLESHQYGVGVIQKTAAEWSDPNPEEPKDTTGAGADSGKGQTKGETPGGGAESRNDGGE